jgi:hypothetical protein
MKKCNLYGALWLGILLLTSGCTVKAVGDPKRPITIEAHVVVDINGLQNTATDIEDFVSGQKPKETISK